MLVVVGSARTSSAWMRPSRTVRMHAFGASPELG